MSSISTYSDYQLAKLCALIVESAGQMRTKTLHHLHRFSICLLDELEPLPQEMWEDKSLDTLFNRDKAIVGVVYKEA